jgi:Na+/H+-dicarboxylate symporter
MKLHTKIIFGMLLGIGWALASAYWSGASFTQDWIAPFGTIFINALKLIAIPLVLFSIIDGVGQLGDPKALGRIGGKALGLYVGTTLVAILIGLAIANLTQPGAYASTEQITDNRLGFEAWLIQEGKPSPDGQWWSQDPANAGRMATLSNQVIDGDLSEKIGAARSEANRGPLAFLVDIVPSNIFLAFTNSLMLQVIFFGLFFGIAIVMLPKEGTKTVRAFMSQSTQVFIKMVEIVMLGAPFFVFALMASTLTKLAGDDPTRLAELFSSFSVYMLTVVGGLLIMALGVYPTIVWWAIRKKGYSWVRTFRFLHQNIRPAQLLAFSTSSSAATLPVTMDCVHDDLKVSEEISQFTLPIGATVNMDGTSLYQAVAVLFLAQMHGLDLSLTQELTIVFTAVMASIGAAAIPSAGLIMLIMVLEAVGLNPAWIAIIFPVDRILDMCRTVINVTGDASVAVAVAESEGEWGG